MKKILVVEDAQSLRKDILEMLSFEGFEVVGAENGIAGVQRAREFSPDLIICDIMMPGLDGYGVLEELHKDPSMAAIPFIFLTARTDRVDIRQGMELGADDYLTKPFTAAELLATVSARLEKSAKLAEVAERKMESLRGNIILALPHELRTPLNVILGFSDLLMIDATSMEPARIADMARHINVAGMRLYRLIENYLLYAHTEIMGNDPGTRAKLSRNMLISPQAYIEQHARRHAAQHDRAGDLAFDLEPVGAIGMLEDYLKKLIEELVDNACKFSQEATPITVSARVVGEYYRVCVSDQGRGMTPEQVNAIGAYMQFERRVYEQQGTGLGLAICRRLVELHGGELTIDSTPKTGTTVCVTIPIRADVADAPSA